MSGAEQQVRAAGIELSVQASDTNLPALIGKFTGHRNPEIRALAVAAEAVMNAATDLQWMSRRYCDGRQSYAPYTHNSHTRTLLALGGPLNPTGDGTLWAADGDATRIGPTPDDLGEEWFSYRSTVTTLNGVIDDLRIKKEVAEAELAGLRAALEAEPGAQPDTSRRCFTGSPQQLAYLRGWQQVRPTPDGPGAG